MHLRHFPNRVMNVIGAMDIAHKEIEDEALHD
jgi:hypothetical protein